MLQAREWEVVRIEALQPDRQRHGDKSGGPQHGSHPVGATENMTAPPTGCPSAEITRQLSTCVPRRKAGGALIVTVVS